MNVEELNKSQLILLTLLVSFVTSIATCIVTVALVQQAPSTVTQNINRIVERTVEKVVPSQSQTASVITQEKTVIIKETDLIAKAVAKASPSVAGIYRNSIDADEPVFTAKGVAVTSGIIATDANQFEKDRTYIVRLPGGDVTARVFVSGLHGVSLLKLDDASSSPKAVPANLNSEQLHLGDTIIGLSGVENLRVSQGIVTNMPGDVGTSTPSTKAIGTSVLATFGSPVINTDGSVVGIVTGTDGTIVPARAILELLKPATSTPGT